MVVRIYCDGFGQPEVAEIHAPIRDVRGIVIIDKMRNEVKTDVLRRMRCGKEWLFWSPVPVVNRFEFWRRGPSGLDPAVFVDNVL